MSRIDGFQFFMPSNDHSPAHVRNAEFNTRIDISGEDAKLMDVSGNQKLEKRALKIATTPIASIKKLGSYLHVPISL